MSVRTTERDARIRALRIEGKTLQEIAADVGVTRERVRQILVRIDGPTAGEVRAAAAVRRSDAAEELAQRVRDDVRAHPASTIHQIADRLGVSRHAVQQHLPDDVRPLVVNPASSSERTWSEEEVVRAVATAATFAYPLGAADYEDLRRAGEVRGPSAARIVQIYGNWSAACHRAGVEPTQPRRRTYQSKWTDDDMLGFVRDYLSSPGCRGTFGGYDSWRRQAGVEAPSSALLRGRLGSWSDIKRKALAR